MSDIPQAYWDAFRNEDDTEALREAFQAGDPQEVKRVLLRRIARHLVVNPGDVELWDAGLNVAKYYQSAESPIPQDLSYPELAKSNVSTLDVIGDQEAYLLQCDECLETWRVEIDETWPDNKDFWKCPNGCNHG